MSEIEKKVEGNRIHKSYPLHLNSTERLKLLSASLSDNRYKSMNGKLVDFNKGISSIDSHCEERLIKNGSMFKKL
jgi:hypothetical protein